MAMRKNSNGNGGVKKRGFASMSESKRKEIASKGGRASRRK